MTKNAFFLQKYLVNSNKSSTFARFFVGNASLRAFPREVKLVSPTEKCSTECSNFGLLGSLLCNF